MRGEANEVDVVKVNQCTLREVLKEVSGLREVPGNG